MADPPTEPREREPAALRCCCGQDDCVFLKHNCSVLDSVEKDVHVAAKMGQALLARHEAYMASAERDRAELNARIEQLELDKAALHESNMRSVEENRALLDQLELLNGTVTESELKIQSLEAALKSTQLTIKMLEGAAARAADMERHIASLEAEQEKMQNELVHSEEEARSALYRWRMAERGIKDMQDQLERMEREAREERERHVEVIGRMERQRAMEKDLNTAAGRLKGAAAAKTLNDGKSGSSVVSHFVRDLLQDNASLQLSMAELREMLMASNDEIQRLREQLLYHQPVEGEVSAASTLRAELEPPGRAAANRISQELHIHHHYHVATKPELKKSKRKRHGLTPGTFAPPGVSLPSTPTAGRWEEPDRQSPTPVLLSHSAKDSPSSVVPPRWSLISEEPSDFAPSSVPSTPLSNRRHSMFDPYVVDMSIPTSPTTSLDPASPSWHNPHRKRTSEAPARPLFLSSRPLNFPSETMNSDNIGQMSQTSSHSPAVTPSDAADLKPTNTSTAIATSMDEISNPTVTTTTTEESVLDTSADDADADDDTSLSIASPEVDCFLPTVPQLSRPLRRVVSHESIMSLSNGMDIHTLKARPSQLTLRPVGAASAGTGISTVTASPTIARGDEGKRGSVILRDNLGLVGLGIPMPPGRNSRRIISGPAAQQQVSEASLASIGGLGRLVSWRLWGSSTPTNGPRNHETSSSPRPSNQPVPGSPSISDSRSTISDGSSASNRALSKVKDLNRAPGINQPGSVPIPGFYEYWAAHQRRGAPSKVRPDVIDRDALREGLEGS